MKICVRQFDESLSTKANKSQIFSMQQNLMKDFVSRRLWEDIELELKAKDQDRET
jgi:hypothetical protein